jgi:hypothetical protein
LAASFSVKNGGTPLKTIVVIVTAYLLTGIIFVLRDVCADIVRQPAYACEYTVRGHISPVILAVFTWFALTVFACTLPGTRLSHLKKEATYWLLFFVLVVAGLYLKG